MEQAMANPRQEMSSFAPRLHTIMISKDKIRDIIGPGGKTIRSIVERTACKIDIEDDGRVNIASVDEAAARKAVAIIEQTGVAIDVEDNGTVSIASSDDASAKKAIEIIKGLTTEPEIGQFYMGTVRRIVDFGAFVEILPGTDGLIHISELDNKRVAKVTDVLNEGDEVLVKVISVDRQGKIRLSRKEALGQTPEVIHNQR